MPELPEVETIRYDLNKVLVGYEIVNFESNSPKTVIPSIKIVTENVENKKILAIKRKAKVIIFILEKDSFLLFHLKMTGRMLIREVSSPEDRWTRAIFFLRRGKNKKELRFADQRKFGYIKFVASKEILDEILHQYGPEPFEDLNLKIFRSILQKKRIAIKKVLLDQQLISGIGNIYANDALFLARIHPETKACCLKESEVKKLYESIIKVLSSGLQYRGASDNSYLDALGGKGHYQEHFVVYNKAGQLCFHCKHTRIKKYQFAGRGTFYCPLCQVENEC